MVISLSVQLNIIMDRGGYLSHSTIYRISTLNVSFDCDILLRPLLVTCIIEKEHSDFDVTHI